jgi:hypothetical protein
MLSNTYASPRPSTAQPTIEMGSLTVTGPAGWRPPTRKSQLDDNLGALDFELPAALRARLDAVSAVPGSSVYSFFTQGLQAMQTGANIVGDKPAGYAAPVLIDAAPAGV